MADQLRKFGAFFVFFCQLSYSIDHDLFIHRSKLSSTLHPRPSPLPWAPAAASRLVSLLPSSVAPVNHINIRGLLKCRADLSLPLHNLPWPALADTNSSTPCAFQHDLEPRTRFHAHLFIRYYDVASALLSKLIPR